MGVYIDINTWNEKGGKVGTVLSPPETTIKGNGKKQGRGGVGGVSKSCSSAYQREDGGDKDLQSGVYARLH